MRVGYTNKELSYFIDCFVDTTRTLNKNDLYKLGGSTIWIDDENCFIIDGRDIVINNRIVWIKNKYPEIPGELFVKNIKAVIKFNSMGARK